MKPMRNLSNERKDAKKFITRSISEGVTNKTELAALVCEKFPSVFKDTETARGFVRYLLGQKGDKSRKEAIRNHGDVANLYNTAKGLAGKKIEPKFPKVLLFDLETSPILAYTWGLYEQNINHEFIVHDWHLLTWSAKWLFGKYIYHDSLTKDEMLTHNDKRICQSLWQMLDEADIIIAHNLKKFDEKKANQRFLINGMQPPSPYQTIDTLVQARKVFNFTSNKLDYINKTLGISRKIQTDYSLWLRCLRGDKKAFKEMQDYNDQDVICLEELYLYMRPWIKSHPNIGLFMDKYEGVCCSCGSSQMSAINKEYKTTVGSFSLYKCSASW
jgi:hypothetical protein